MKWWNWMPWSLFFWCWVLSQLFLSPFSPSSRGSLVPLHFLPLKWYHLPIWGCCYFFQQSWFQLVLHAAQNFSCCTAYKLNNQDDNIQPWHTPFPILNQLVVLCPVLTVASCPAYRFLRRQVRWSGIPISLRTFQFVAIHTVKVFSIVCEAEVDVFLEFPCFLHDLVDVDDLISHSPACSKSCLNIWNFLVHIPLKPSLKDFKHNLASMWSECSCMAAWTFFDITFLWDWSKNTFSSPVATVDFSKFAVLLSAELKQILLCD